MILDRQSFKYHEKVLVEKAVFSRPYRKEGVFQNEGCFLYIKNVGVTLYAPDGKLDIQGREAVLLKCGTYFWDFVKNNKDDKLEVIAFHLIPDVLKDIYIKELPALVERNRKNPKTKVVVPEDTIAKFIESLEFYFQNPTLVNEDLLELKTRELILLLVQTKNEESLLELLSDLYSERTVNIKNVIELHLFSDLSVEELAKLSGLSLSSFKREFKKEFNDSPKNYINQKRIEKAKELLKISELSISEIAYDIGYNDPQYFTRLFKKTLGITPTEFRTK